IVLDVACLDIGENLFFINVTKQRKPKSPLQLVDEFVDEGVPEQEPVYGDEEADIQRAVELSIKKQAE
ncbi:hypothetical protein Tco_1272019, partial [Tanacetum coccineum]